MKKIIAMILALALMVCMSTSALAAETGSRFDGGKIEKHTIELVAKPGVNTITASNDSGIMPMIWNQNTYTVKYGGKFYTAYFSVPDRYFAYEATVTAASGVTGNCTVNFMYDSTVGIAGITCTANGPMKKADWITIPSVGEKNYSFRMINGATGDVNVKITYYSWA